MSEPPHNQNRGPVRLRFCINNAPPVVQRALEAVGAEGHDCFGRCRRCYTTPYVVIGDRPPGEITEDDVVEAETFEALLDRARSLSGAR